MQRFLRIEKLLGAENHQKITNSFVVVVGVGAVGGYCIEALARSGVGRLRLVDFDEISITNINRQIIALDSTIGQKKVDVMAKRIKDINPQCQVELLSIFAHNDTFAEILADGPDLVIDAIDSCAPKVQLLRTCYEEKIKIFSSMGAALRRDITKLHFTDISKTINCPLARRMRKKLKKYGIYKGIDVVWSDEVVDFDYEDPDPNGPTEGPTGRVRRVLGSLPTITAIFGLMLANAAIDYLQKK